MTYLSLHCNHQNDFGIKMDSDESHFNVSVGSDGQNHKTMDKVTRQCPQTTTFLKRKESRSGIEPRWGVCVDHCGGGERGAGGGGRGA